MSSSSPPQSPPPPPPGPPPPLRAADADDDEPDDGPSPNNLRWKPPSVKEISSRILRSQSSRELDEATAAAVATAAAGAGAGARSGSGGASATNTTPGASPGKSRGPRVSILKRHSADGGGQRQAGAGSGGAPPRRANARASFNLGEVERINYRSSDPADSTRAGQRHTMDLGTAVRGGRGGGGTGGDQQQKPQRVKRASGGGGLRFSIGSARSSSVGGGSEASSGGRRPRSRSAASAASSAPSQAASSSVGTSSHSAGSAARRWFGGGCCGNDGSGGGSCCLPKPALDRIDRLISSTPWVVVTIFFTLLLLFGSQVRDLWCPPSSDVVFDVLNTAALVFLLLDVLLRSLTHPAYFVLHTCGRDLRADGSASPAGTGEADGGGRGSQPSNSCGCLDRLCGIGSFMFWCDILSTLSLLWDISYVSAVRFEMLKVNIFIDEFGIPMSGTGIYNENSPLQLGDSLTIEVLVAIARTLRVSRFIKTSAVVKTSSRVDWYWLPDRLDPMFWIRKCRGGSGYGDGRGEGGGILAELTDGTPQDGSFGAGGSSVKRRGSLSRLSSLSFDGGASSSARAARPLEPAGGGGDGGSGGPFQSFLAFFGFRSKSEVARRQSAAIRIQRAWRAHRAASGKFRSSNGSRPSSAAAASGGGRSKSGSSKLASLRKSVLPRRRTTPTTAADRLDRSGSQVGSAMRELTGQRVAIGIVVSLILTVLFTYNEINSTSASVMIVLHKQTQTEAFRNASIDAARNSTIPDLYMYRDAAGETTSYDLESGQNPDDLREREKVRMMIVEEKSGRNSTGYFDNSQATQDQARVELVDTIFILLVWFFGVTAFAGPVMTLVVIPIERMIRLLSMLMKDPLGYQGTPRYRKFVAEEDNYTKNTKWTKDVLKGMETSFLMSTILRIGSLMKVGFGSAGVEIIRNNLTKGDKKDDLFLNTQGSTVSCIFLFCDIRQFTDATECLQEEVFVFTNKIAAVVHSICHSYGGSANKNIGDAFLVSWLLSDEESGNSDGGGSFDFGGAANRLAKKHSKADKALLAVVKISISLYHDKYFVESMSEARRNKLLAKIAKRPGPVVQMGCGLHSGKAVQGAIGSQRKLDATYVSEAVERAEFLESSTKKFGVQILMSDAFHDLLTPSTQRRCRKVDQILILDDDIDPDDPDLVELGEVLEIYTFDMDIDELWRQRVMASQSEGLGLDGPTTHTIDGHDLGSSSRPPMTTLGAHTTTGSSGAKSRRDLLKFGAGPSTRKREDFGKGRRRASLINMRPSRPGTSSGLLDESMFAAAEQAQAAAEAVEHAFNERGVPINLPELVLPTEPVRYNPNVWQNEEMRMLRQKFSDGLFFQKFNAGLQAFYTGDWSTARNNFASILDRFDDGPSRYFMRQIERNNGTPPRKFLGYGLE